MEYNDFVICKSSFGKILARYICLRPDKKTIIVDYENKLHEFKIPLIKAATREIVENYYNEKIYYYESCIVEIEKDLENNKIAQKINAKLLKDYLKKQNELISKLDALKVMKEINDSNHKDSNHKDIVDITSQLNFASYSTEDTKRKIETIKRNIKYSKNRLRIFKAHKKVWEKEKDKNLGGNE